VPGNAFEFRRTRLSGGRQAVLVSVNLQLVDAEFRLVILHARLVHDVDLLRHLGRVDLEHPAGDGLVSYLEVADLCRLKHHFFSVAGSYDVAAGATGPAS
jgi:hypothetical protein